MDFLSILLIAIGLSMDSFAVSISRGICSKRLKISQALLLAVIFGVFQGIMPLIGFGIGRVFANQLIAIDHWVAFVILVLIGIKMIIESLKETKEENSCDCDGNCKNRNFKIKYLVILAIATSIDALATGLIFTTYPDKILLAVSVIGIVTFAFSYLGVNLGYKFGSKFKFNFEIIGGIVLIIIGLRILIEHLTS
ncbi:MAG: manganese efflux pump MntP [Paludibacteraceae bacterium]